MPETPFDSNDAFHDLVGRYREVGIDEFLFYWLREEALECGYDLAWSNPEAESLGCFAEVLTYCASPIRL